METRKKKSFKRLFAFLMAFVMVTTLAASAIFAAEPTFKDVPEDYEFYDEIEDLAAKEIVGGFGTTGLFKPEEKLTRAQAAKMIAKAADIKVSKGFETSFTDVDEDVDMYEHIWALEELEIVKGWGTTKEFRPDEAIERGHVAKMIALAFGIADGSTKVEFKDLPADKEVAGYIMALATNDIVKGYGTSGEFRPEEPVLRGQFAKMVSRAMNLDLEIVEAKAVSPTIVELTLNKKLAKLARTDVVITNVKTTDRQYVKGVDLDEEVVEVELFDALITKSTYKAKIGSAEKEFDYVLGDKRIVVASTPQIVPAGVETAIEYEVFDENGLDVTDITAVEYETNLAATKFDHATGKILLVKGEQAFIYVVAVDAQGKELARSGRILAKAEELKAIKILGYTLASETPDFEAKNFKASTTLQLTDVEKTLYAWIEDQFGDDYVVNTSVTPETLKAKFESLNKGIVLVDQTTGEITPLKAGAADVRITIGTFSVVRPITVVADSKLTSLELEEASLELSSALLAGEGVTVVAKDQYGEEIVVAVEALSATVKTGTTIVSVSPEKNLSADSEHKFTVKPLKEGTATIEFAVGDIKTTLTVTVVKPGDLEDYIVEGFKSKLDHYVENSAKDPQTMTLSVFGVDADGVKVGPAVAADVEIVSGKDKDGKAIVKTDLVSYVTVSGGVITPNTSKIGTFTVEVKVGTLKVFSGDFQVVDTTPDPDKVHVEQIKDKITLDMGSRADALHGALADIFVFTKAGSAYNQAIVDVVFNSDNTAVYDKGATPTSVYALSKGAATLIIKEIKFSDDTVVEVDNLRVDVTVASPVVKIVHDATKKTIKITFREEAKLGTGAFSTAPDAYRLYAVTKSGTTWDYQDSTVGLTYDSYEAKTLELTYSTEIAAGRYIVDAWGYDIIHGGFKIANLDYLDVDDVTFVVPAAS